MTFSVSFLRLHRTAAGRNISNTLEGQVDGDVLGRDKEGERNRGGMGKFVI